jgi:hypothetical protein
MGVNLNQWMNGACLFLAMLPTRLIMVDKLGKDIVILRILSTTNTSNTILLNTATCWIELFTLKILS